MLVCFPLSPSSSLSALILNTMFFLCVIIFSNLLAHIGEYLWPFDNVLIVCTPRNLAHNPLLWCHGSFSDNKVFVHLFSASVFVHSLDLFVHSSSLSFLPLYNPKYLYQYFSINSLFSLLHAVDTIFTVSFHLSFLSQIWHLARGSEKQDFTARKADSAITDSGSSCRWSEGGGKSNDPDAEQINKEVEYGVRGLVCFRCNLVLFTTHAADV